MNKIGVLPRFAAAGILPSVLLFLTACAPTRPAAEPAALPSPVSPTVADVPILTDAPATAMPTVPPATPRPTEGEKREEGEKTATPTPLGEEVFILQPDVEKAVAAAKTDLMGRLGVGEEEIFIKSVEAVRWRDTSLGCPQPGMMYAQVITPGFRVVLTAEGKDYEYHTDMNRAVYCPST